jgi:hypothetical protein
MLAMFVILLFLLAGSGCAALIYEIVWFQLLQLVIGSSAVSLGLLLAFYMGGLCLGSALYPRFVSRRRNPLRVYVLEAGIARRNYRFVLRCRSSAALRCRYDSRFADKWRAAQWRPQRCFRQPF